MLQIQVAALQGELGRLRQQAVDAVHSLRTEETNDKRSLLTLREMLRRLLNEMKLALLPRADSLSFATFRAISRF